MTVGDVVGRGLGAASAMGQLRSAVRAVAGPDAGPGSLLSRLDRFVEHVEAAGMATLAYAELDLATGELRYACAGHPPPLLIPLEGEPHLLWAGRSTPLGAYSRPQRRGEARVRLREGDRILLYTDGLVERRDRALDQGLRLLERAAGHRPDRQLDDTVRQLTQTMLVGESTRDDVCVLLLAWNGSQFVRRVPADLSALSAARSALNVWLSAHGVDHDTRSDVVLAASEALANAAEHGSGLRTSDHVHVHARVDRRSDGPDDVVVTVRDRGRWLTSNPARRPRARSADHVRAGRRGRRRRRRRDHRGPAPRAARGTAMTMHVMRAHDDEGVTVLRARGELDVAVVPALLPELPALVSAAEAVVLDLTAVTFFDSSGVRLVDRLARECARAQAPFRVVAPPRSASRQVLDVVGLSDALASDDLTAALRFVRRTA